MDLNTLKGELRNYKAGSILNDENELGPEAFSAAQEGEMEKMAIRIGLFGFTGSGKSSFVNTLYKCVFDDKYGKGVIQSSGAEGTTILEEYFHDTGFRVVDTRGFMTMEHTEERELFKIVSGRVHDGDEIKRDGNGTTGSDDYGLVRLLKTPLKDQMHVVLWFVKATDPRLSQELYAAKNAYVNSYLRKTGITILPVVTFTDMMDPGNRSSVERTVKKMCGQTYGKVWFITNYQTDNPAAFKQQDECLILQLLRQALEDGEYSLRGRQIKRSKAMKGY